jgi:predicted RecB family nuclease
VTDEMWRAQVVVDLDELIWLDRCPRRLWLDHHEDPAAHVPPTRDAVARSEANRAHVRRVVAAMPGAADAGAGEWEERRAATADLLRNGAPLVAWGALEASAGDLTIRATAHLLQRVPDPQAPAGWTYRPAEIRLHGEPTRSDRSRLDALRWLVGVTLGQHRAPVGELWLGASGASSPARVLERRVDATHAGPTLARRLAATWAGEAPPLWFDSDHCPFCPWHAACDLAAQASQDLALLPGLRRSHARALRSLGVTTVPQVVALTAAELGRIRDSDGATARRVRESALALLSGEAVRRAPAVDETEERPSPTVSVAAAVGAERPLFLDIETDPLTRAPWAIGWRDHLGRVSMAIVSSQSKAGPVSFAGLNLLLVPSVEAAWRLVAREAEMSDRVFHWGDAESLLLAQTGGEQEREAIAPLLHDLHAVLGAELALPIARLSTRRSAGLKPVAGWLGLRWPEGADHWADGWEAYLRWRQALADATERSGYDALGPAVAYLRADLDALALVWGWLAGVSGAAVDA